MKRHKIEGIGCIQPTRIHTCRTHRWHIVDGRGETTLCFAEKMETAVSEIALISLLPLYEHTMPAVDVETNWKI